MRWIIGVVMTGLLAGVAESQAVRLSAFAVGGDYREQSSALSFGGTGVAGQLDLRAGRFGITVAASRLEFSRTDNGAAELQPFQLENIDARVRARLVSIVSVEVGVVRRWIAPEEAAQAFRAARVGLRADYRLAPGADGNLRVAALGGTKFSGGGTARLGVVLGFGLSYGAKRRGVRLTADYDFLRIDRETAVAGSLVPVPLQASTARVGLMLVL